MNLRPYQSRTINELWAWFRAHPEGNPVIEATVGCHPKGQKIILYDGTVKNVEDVCVGDALMGDDGTPRNVLKLIRGHGKIYKITPTKGESFLANEDHVLSLKLTPRKPGDDYKLVSMTVGEYLALPRWKSKDSKLYRSSAIERFGNSGLPSGFLDPYFVGVFLGDGSCVFTGAKRYSTPSVTTADPEIVNAVYDIAGQFGMTVTVNNKGNGNKASSYLIRSIVHSRSKANMLTAKLHEAGILGATCGNKRVPVIYKTADLNARLNLLAGLIDTDGALSRGGYDFISKSRGLSDDVLFLARSAGLAAYMKQCTKTCGKDFSETYYRVSISGDCSIIPVRIVRKKAPERKQKKSVLVTGFSVDYVNDDDYYGFQLDGNHLYLLDDFTVTHNSGKSLMIAETIRQALEYPGTRVLMCVSSRELCRQNAEKLLTIWPDAPVGIYSAGLKSRCLDKRIIYATIGSVHKRWHELGRVDLMMIDEAHNVSSKDKGMYRGLIRDLHTTCPNMRVVGWTGTAYYGNGIWITDAEDPLFTDIAARVSMRELLDERYLSPLTVPKVGTHLSAEGVGMRGGDFITSQLAKQIDKQALVDACADELVNVGAERRRWFVFGATVEHCHHIKEALIERGIPSAVISANTPHTERDATLSMLRSGQLRAIVNVATMTTGIDVPELDLICLMRNTRSPVLLCQIAGRGMRTASGKVDCMMVDFTDTLIALGPVDLLKGRARSKSGTSDAPFKVCDECGTRNTASARLCIECGAEFEIIEKPRHNDQISHAPALSTTIPEPKTVIVDDIRYSEWPGRNGNPPTLRVDYYSGMLRSASEWVALGHTGFARSKAVAWWVRRAPGQPIPESAQQALQQTASLIQPSAITITTHGKYPEIKGYVWTDTTEAERRGERTTAPSHFADQQTACA